MADQRLNAQYCYTRKELETARPLDLMLYLENRYGLPRAKAVAKDHPGPYSVTLSQHPEKAAEWIWVKYQEEDLAGKKALSKKAPRDPVFTETDKGEEPPTTTEGPSPETTKPPEGQNEGQLGESPTPTPPEEVKAGRPRGRPRKSAPETTTPPQVEDPLQKSLKRLEATQAVVLGLLNTNGEQIKALATDLEATWENLSNLVTSQHSLTLVIGALVGELLDYDPLRLDIDTINEHLKKSLVYTSLKTQQEILERSIDEADTRPPSGEEGTEEAPEEEVSTEEDGEEILPVEGVENVGFRIQDNSIVVSIDGESIAFHLQDLTEEKDYPLVLLRKIGVGLGLDLRGVDDRMTAIHLIMDKVTPKIRH